jgi:hypothetical protein
LSAGWNRHGERSERLPGRSSRSMVMAHDVDGATHTGGH